MQAIAVSSVMRRVFVTLALVLTAACGGGASSQKARDLEEFQKDQFANEETCEQAVTNFEKAEFDASNVPAAEKGLFNRVEFDQRHRDRVYRCQKMTQRQAECFAQAPSMQYIQNCERFAELQ